MKFSPAIILEQHTIIVDLARKTASDFVSAIRSDPKLCEAYANLAQLSSWLERYASALAFYKKARDCGYKIKPDVLKYFQEAESKPIPSWSTFEIISDQFLVEPSTNK